MNRGAWTSEGQGAQMSFLKCSSDSSVSRHKTEHFNDFPFALATKAQILRMIMKAPCGPPYSSHQAPL